MGYVHIQLGCGGCVTLGESSDKGGVQEPNNGSRGLPYQWRMGKESGEMELPRQVAQQQVGRMDTLIPSFQMSK